MTTVEEIWESRDREFDEYLTEVDEEKIAALLVGRRVVEVLHEGDTGYLRLDDGAILKIEGNEGCGGCGNGWYTLTELMGMGGVDNIITSVTFLNRPDGDDHPLADHPGLYKIFIFAENHVLKLPLASFEGSDGNGYYGTGYTVYVRHPKADEDYKALAASRDGEDEAFEAMMRERVRDREEPLEPGGWAGDGMK